MLLEAEALELGQAAEREDDHEAGKPERDRGGERERAPVAGEEPPAAREQGGDLRGEARTRHGVRGGVGRGGLGARRDGGTFFQPLLDRMFGEAVVERERVGDAEVGEQGGVRALKNDRALIDDGDDVELSELGEVVDDAEHGAVLLGDEATQDGEDLVLAARIEAARHLVAEQAGGLGGELEREAEAAELPAGEFFHQRVGALGQADEPEQGGQAGGDGGVVMSFSIQAQRGGEGLADREFAVGDAELRGEGDLAQERLAVGRGRAAQEDFAARRQDAEQALEQGGLAAAGRADEGVEATGGEVGVGGAHQRGGAGAGEDVERTAGEHA